MKHIFTSIALLIAKIAMFGECVISGKQMHAMHTNMSLFGADFGQEASSDHTFLRMRLVKQQMLMLILDIATWWHSSFCWNWMILWFQQDDATVNETIQLLHETFPGRLFFRFDDQSWPSRSCNLISLDFFLGGYLKLKVNVNIMSNTMSHNHTYITRRN